LRTLNFSDFILTNNQTEREALVKTGKWLENCSPIWNPTAFCVNPADPDGRSGPFILFNNSTAAANLSALYRCVSSSGQHFISTDNKCEGTGTAEQTIGYVAAAPGGEALRALRRCKGSVAGSRLHALDLLCDLPDLPQPLGYVR